MPIFLNLNSLFSASHRQMKTMKVLILGSAASLALALAIYAQTPVPTGETPAATPETPSASPALTTPPASASPTLSATASPANQFADQIKQRVERKFKHGKFWRNH